MKNDYDISDQLQQRACHNRLQCKFKLNQFPKLKAGHDMPSSTSSRVATNTVQYQVTVGTQQHGIYSSLCVINCTFTSNQHRTNSQSARRNYLHREIQCVYCTAVYCTVVCNLDMAYLGRCVGRSFNLVLGSAATNDRNIRHRNKHINAPLYANGMPC